MKAPCLFSIILFTFTACHQNNNTTDAALQQPPYNGLTDSIQQEPQNAMLYYKRAALLLQNDQVNFDIVLTEGTVNKPQLYTQKDKFMNLAEKNPALIYLTKKFGLDL